MDKNEEHRILEESLLKALDEAWTKTTAALEQVAKISEGRDKALWLATESVEYASLLFSMTNDLEDVDPPPPPTKGKDIASLVKESVSTLGKVRASGQRKEVEDYTSLRATVHNLRTAYFELLKKPGKRGSL